MVAYSYLIDAGSALVINLGPSQYSGHAVQNLNGQATPHRHAPTEFFLPGLSAESNGTVFKIANKTCSAAMSSSFDGQKIILLSSLSVQTLQKNIPGAKEVIISCEQNTMPLAVEELHVG